MFKSSFRVRRQRKSQLKRYFILCSNKFSHSPTPTVSLLLPGSCLGHQVSPAFGLRPVRSLTQLSLPGCSRPRSHFSPCRNPFYLKIQVLEQLRVPVTLPGLGIFRWGNGGWTRMKDLISRVRMIPQLPIVKGFINQDCHRKFGF